MEPKVTLLSWTKNPLELVYSVWQSSKDDEPLMTVDQVAREVPRAELESLFKRVIQQRIPVGEHIDFVFMIEGVSVSWREQAVRHRIGTLPSPERLGADIVVDGMPDLASSSWWSQSMRIMSMGSFAEKERYRLPDTVVKAGPEVEADFKASMKAIEDAYNRLVASGVPMEDARELIPLGAQHRISWKLNIGSLQHIASKRSCWILQLGIWGPVIQGMISELIKKVDPVFRELSTPPCIVNDEFKACIYHEENARRYTQDDAHPVCPLHFEHHGKDFTTERDVRRLPMAKEMAERSEAYRAFWGRDPRTGVASPVASRANRDECPDCGRAFDEGDLLEFSNGVEKRRCVCGRLRIG